MSAPRMTAREWALLICLSFLWGSSFFFAAVALKEVSHHALAFFRVFVAALALGGAMLLMRVPIPRDWMIWRGMTVLGLIGSALPFSLLYWAQTHIASGLVAILNAMVPIFTILAAHVFTRDEKIDARRLAGVIASLGGVAVIVGPSAMGHFDGDLWAEAAVLSAGLCYASASIYGRRFKTESPVFLSFGQMVVASVYLLPVMLITAPPLHVPVPSLVTIACVLAVGILSTALAYVVFIRILNRAGATNAVLVTLLVPVSAILLGVLVLGETIAPRQFAGLLLIGVGLLINDGRPLEYVRGRLARMRERPDVGGSPSPAMLNEPHHSQ